MKIETEYDQRSRSPETGKLYMPSYGYGLTTKAPNGGRILNMSQNEK